MRVFSREVKWWVAAWLAVVSTGCVGVGGVTLNNGQGQGSGATGAWQHTRVERGAESPAVPAVAEAEEPKGGGEGILRRRHSERMWGTEVAMLSPGEMMWVVVAGRVWEVDAVEGLLLQAGLNHEEELPRRGRELTPEGAMRVMGVLLRKKLTLGNYGPRQAANHLLREVMVGGKGVGREELLRRVKRYEKLGVLRPDGYLAWAVDGKTQQKVKGVEWREGAFRAGNYELGRFYHSAGGVWREVDERLEPEQEPVLGEVYDDGDVLNRSVEGAVDAGLELVDALGKALSFPWDTLTGLPQGVAALIEAYPGYRERLKYMTKGEQMREMARLVTMLVVTVGTAGGASGAVARVGVSVPMLTVSAEGVVALEMVAVPVGQGVVALGVGASAIAVMSQASAWSGGIPPVEGPGKWEYANEHMSDPARKYQAQVSGAPEHYAYVIGKVHFDGYRNGVLLEAKGTGYAKHIPNAVENKGWYRGFEKMVEQARRQSEAARGAPIEWHFAEREAADFARKLFQQKDLGHIKVIYTPPAF